MQKQIDILNIKGLKVVNIKNNSPVGYFGIFCLNGFAHEKPSLHGIAHFSEHMFFKGTQKRTWKQINRDFAKIGASSNAYTASDETCYYVTAINEKFPEAAEILCDMFFNSVYNSEEIEKERLVILEEKKMYDDDPSYNFASKCGDLLSPCYGHDSLGSLDTIASIKKEDILTYLDQTLGSENIMFVYCGQIPSENLTKILENLIPNDHKFVNRKEKNYISSGLWSEICNNDKKIKLIYQRKNIEQAQITGFMESFSFFDALKPEEIIALACLGGGDYSVMFEILREDMGLCYALGVHNDVIEYPHIALSRIYGLVDNKNIINFIDETENIFKKINSNGIDQDLFECAKNSVSAAIARAAETSKGKASFYMKKLFYNKFDSVDEYINRLQSASLDNCNKVAQILFDFKKIKWAVMVDDSSKIIE